jgi:hypothetical protein
MPSDARLGLDRQIFPLILPLTPCGLRPKVPALLVCDVRRFRPLARSGAGAGVRRFPPRTPQGRFRRGVFLPVFG